MKLLVLVSFIAAVAADTLQSYSLPTHSGPGVSSGGSSFVSGGSGFGSGGSGFGSGGSGFGSGGSGFVSGGSGFSGGSCGPGQVRHVDGSCVTPVVTRNVYVYDTPDVPPIVGPPPKLPLPKLEHNIIFVHAPDNVVYQKPIVVPPPKRTNTVYVLKKRPELSQDVIHVPDGEQETPEVFFVTYNDGDNPTLPTGEKLQDALSAASHGGGQVIGGGGAGVGIGGGVGVGFGAGGGVGVGVVGHGGTHGVTTPSSLYSAP